MFAALLVPVVLAPSKTPQEALQAVETRYEGLYKFSAHLVHHNSSGLFPGDFEQDLSWTAPATFTLTVSKPATGQERMAGNFSSDGTSVHVTGGSFPAADQPIEHDVNTTPGYEVAGGPVMSWLMHSPTGKFFLSPPAGFKVGYAWGKEAEWHGIQAWPIIFSITMSGHPPVVVNLYLSDKLDEVVGYDAEPDHGYMIYEKQVFVVGKLSG